jgi:hypothetical protein
VIKKLLRNIRQKPKAVREQYAFWIACSLTSVVALVWVATTWGQFDAAAGSEETAATKPDTLSDFMEGTQSQMSSLQQQVQDILPVVQPEDTDTVDTEVSATSSNQAAAVIPAPPVTARQEIRIATTSATSATGQGSN